MRPPRSVPSVGEEINHQLSRWNALLVPLFTGCREPDVTLEYMLEVRELMRQLNDRAEQLLAGVGVEVQTPVPGEDLFPAWIRVWIERHPQN